MMDTVLAAVQEWGIAQYLRHERWPYAALNASHIIGIALLFGASLPLSMRLLGFWKAIPVGAASRLCSPVAAFGALVAITTGVLLFSVRASEYASLPIFRIKLIFIFAGLVSALLAHARFGVFLDSGHREPSAIHGAISLAAWMSAVVCGRLIAFVDT